MSKRSDSSGASAAYSSSRRGVVGKKPAEMTITEKKKQLARAVAAAAAAEEVAAAAEEVAEDVEDMEDMEDMKETGSFSPLIPGPSPNPSAYAGYPVSPLRDESSDEEYSLERGTGKAAGGSGDITDSLANLGVALDNIAQRAPPPTESEDTAGTAGTFDSSIVSEATQSEADTIASESVIDATTGVNGVARLLVDITYRLLSAIQRIPAFSDIRTSVAERLPATYVATSVMVDYLKMLVDKVKINTTSAINGVDTAALYANVMSIAQLFTNPENIRNVAVGSTGFYLIYTLSMAKMDTILAALVAILEISKDQNIIAVFSAIKETKTAIRKKYHLLRREKFGLKMDDTTYTIRLREIDGAEAEIDRIQGEILAAVQINDPEGQLPNLNAELVEAQASLAALNARFNSPAPGGGGRFRTTRKMKKRGKRASTRRIRRRQSGRRRASTRRIKRRKSRGSRSYKQRPR